MFAVVKRSDCRAESTEVEDALRVSCTDGRAFISSAPLEAWQHPFAPLKPRISRTKADKLARKARQAGVPTATATTDRPETAPEPQIIKHYVMNLPDSALEFLDAYRGCFDRLLALPDFKEKYGSKGETVPMPLVHVHCFTRELEYPGAERDISEVRLLTDQLLTMAARDFNSWSPCDERHGWFLLALRAQGSAEQGHVLSFVPLASSGSVHYPGMIAIDA